MKSYDKLVQLTEEEIDEWKDVAVGWRIKLKKGVRVMRDNNKGTNDGSTTTGVKT